MEEKIVLTGEEAEKYLKYKQDEELAAEKAKLEEDRKTYKMLVSDTVTDKFAKLQQLSGDLAKAKGEIYEAFEEILKLKGELYGYREDQRSHTFSSADGRCRITIGNYLSDNYDDTAADGVAKVKSILAEMINDEDTRFLVSSMMNLLSGDSDGNLKASKVIILKQHALESRRDNLIEAVEIIEKAYNPILSKLFIRAEYKDEKTGKWINVPLGMTEA